MKKGEKTEFLVYGLVDPRTDELRYVGETTRPTDRKFEHLVSKIDSITEKTKLGNWLRGLSKLKLRPKFVEMEWHPDLESMHIGQDFWIYYHRDEGTALLNVLGGGIPMPRAVMVAELNDYILHDGRRWKTETTLKKKSVKSAGIEEMIPVIGLECDPDGEEFFERDGGRYLNTYAPPNVTPIKGAHPIIDKLLAFLCDGDEGAVRYLTHWIARKVQDPGRRSMTAVVLCGSYGTGKDFLASVVMEMIGGGNCARLGESALRGQFNAHYAEKLLIVADEVVGKDNLYNTDMSSLLKQLITDETVMMRPMYAPYRMVTNRMSWMFTSNDTVPIRIEGKDDRRYSVFQNLKPATEEHKAMLLSCGHKGSFSDQFLQTEVAAFMHHLIHLKVDNDLLRRPYENEARRMLVKAGINSVEAFGTLLKDMGLEDAAKELRGTREYEVNVKPNQMLQELQWMRSGRCRSDVLFVLYGQFCSKYNYVGKYNESKFGVELRKVISGLEHKRATGEKRDASDARKDRTERPWVYDGLPVTPYDREPEPDISVQNEGKNRPTTDSEIVAWGWEWIEKNPGKRERVTAAIELEFGRKIPLSEFAVNKSTPKGTPNKTIDLVKFYKSAVFKRRSAINQLHAKMKDIVPSSKTWLELEEKRNALETELLNMKANLEKETHEPAPLLPSSQGPFFTKLEERKNDLYLAAAITSGSIEEMHQKLTGSIDDAFAKMIADEPKRE